KVATGHKLRQRPTSLRSIPGVGPSIERDLLDLGVRRVGDLPGKDPQRLYDRLIAIRGAHQDRCLLYVFRSAVYFAETSRPRPDLLLWWNWKDR
ncbi:MAG: helix-hairpin-helix domain-containing protein, partial [Gemmatimonadota bacterium]|nr:helix-hairpin-helix domain-containing protein [Gemmatimonadota bacterium]